MQDYEPTLAAMGKLGTWRFIFFFSVMSVQGTSALRTQTRIVENTTLKGIQTYRRELVLDQHNKSQFHHGFKLHLVSKNLRKRKTKSLSGWKLKCYRSSEKLTIRWETVTKALQIIKHMFYFTTFSQRKIRRFETKLLLPVSVHLKDSW